MKATLESTSKVVTLVEPDRLHLQARIWEGCTEKGVRFHAYIVRVAVANDLDQTQFAAELQETRTPSADVAAIPMRLIL
jgi:hypothetical protein